MTYQCSDCNFITTKPTYLKTHKESKHAGIRYPCKQCDYAATTASSLKRHKQYKHEGLRYPCDQCEYVATRSSYLKSHKEARHDTLATNVTSLLRQLHLSRYTKKLNTKYKIPLWVRFYESFKPQETYWMNEGIRYPYGHCNYAAYILSHLKRHKKFKH